MTPQAITLLMGNFYKQNFAGNDNQYKQKTSININIRIKDKKLINIKKQFKDNKQENSINTNR